MATSRRNYRKKISSSRKGKRNISRSRRSRKGHRRFTRKNIGGGGEVPLKIADLTLDDTKLEKLRESNESILHVLDGVTVQKINKKGGILGLSKKPDENEDLYKIIIKDKYAPPQSIQYFILETILENFSALDFRTIIQTLKTQYKNIYSIFGQIVELTKDTYFLYRKSKLVCIECKEKIENQDLKIMTEIQRNIIYNMTRHNAGNHLIKIDIDNNNIHIDKNQENLDIEITKINDRYGITDPNAVKNMIDANIIVCKAAFTKGGYNTKELLITFIEKELGTIIWNMMNIAFTRVKNITTVEEFVNGHKTVDPENEKLRDKYDNNYINAERYFNDPEYTHTLKKLIESFDKNSNYNPTVVLEPITKENDTKTKTARGFSFNTFFDSKEKKDFKIATNFIYINSIDEEHYGPGMDHKQNYLSKNLRGSKSKDTGYSDFEVYGINNSEYYKGMKISKAINSNQDIKDASNYIINSNTIVTLNNFGAKIQNLNTEELLYLRKEFHNYNDGSRRKINTTEVSSSCHPLKPSVFRDRVLNYFKSLIEDSGNYRLIPKSNTESR